MKTKKYKQFRLFSAIALAYLQTMCASASKAESSVSPETEIQLTAVVALPKGYIFNLRTTEPEKSTWASIGQVVFGNIKIINYNKETGELLLQSNKQEAVVKLIKSDNKSMLIKLDHEHVDDFCKQTDIDPDKLLKQSFHSIRSKIKHSVEPRDNYNKSISHQSPKQALTGTQPTDDVSSNESPQTLVPTLNNPVSSQISTPLNGEEIISLEAYEKNYISAREPPRDVDIIYAVEPRPEERNQQN